MLLLVGTLVRLWSSVPETSTDSLAALLTSKWIHTMQVLAQTSSDSAMSKSEAETMRMISDYLEDERNAGDSPSLAARLLRYWAVFVSGIPPEPVKMLTHFDSV